MSGALMSDGRLTAEGQPTPRERREAEQFRVCKACGLFDRRKDCPKCRKATEPLEYQGSGLVCPGCGEPMTVTLVSMVD